MSGERLVTAREVADWLGVTTSTVLRWTKEDKLPGFRLPGGALRYRASDLTEWLEERTTRKELSRGQRDGY